jgi:subtilase family serine protease
VNPFRTPSSLLTAFAAAAFLAACGGEAQIAQGTDPTEVDNRPAEIQALPQFPHKSLCAASGVPGEMHCMAKVRTDASGNVTPNAAPSGLSPADLQAAYKIPANAGDGLTIAIVDAQDDPTAEADLAKYRSQFGLPACTSANGCFKKVNQNGAASPLPSADKGWAGEIALDLDMVSAACPSCKILLVEATSATDANLGKAVDTAVSMGAVAVSNSYGGDEGSSDSSANSHYNHPGVIITASAGDDGYGVEYPAASPYVTAVGGTTLAKSSSGSRGWVESVWGSSNNKNGGTGSGCSSYETKPSWQKDSSCSKRMVADVAAVADPNSGVAVYDGYGSGGWQVYGGTSAASPLVAAILALTGHASDSLGYSYSHTSAFFDVTSGVNGSCSTSYFCKGVSGYDGPTGNGTPNATAMMSGSSSTSTSGSSTSGTSSSGSGSTTGSGSTSGSSTGSSGSTSGTTGSGGSVLTNGVALTGLSGASSSHTWYTFNVPAGATNVKVTVSGGSGNANLYVKLGSTASASNYDCRSIGSTNTDSCTFATSAGGTYSVMLLGNTAYSGVTLEGTYSAGGTSGSGSTGGGSTGGSTGTSGGGTGGLQDGQAITVSGAKSSHTYYSVTVPSGTSSVNVQISGGSGNANLYVKYGSQVSTTDYDCRSTGSTNSDHCTFTPGQAGTYYIVLYGNQAYSGVSLEADY